MFRAVAARLNYLSKDRPDITFATMTMCTKMSRPDAQDLKNMKRVRRFFAGRPRVWCLFEWQACPSALHARLTRILQETDNQEHRSAENWVHGSSDVCQRPG